MKIFQPLRNWWQARTGEVGTLLDGDAPAWLISLVIHLGLLIVLTVLFSELPVRSDVVELTSVPVLEDFEQPAEFFYSDNEMKDIGANSVAGLAMADSLSDVEQELTQVKASQMTTPQVDTSLGEIVLRDPIPMPSGTELSQMVLVQGASGVGVTGAEGAVDRITQEILDSLQQRKTLVVWMFDQSLSLSGQRATILRRLDRIYEELGVVEASQHPAFAKHESKPLLTAVFAYGKNIHLLTPRPTDELAEIKAAVAGIQNDDSGVEKTFTTVFRAAEQYKSYVTARSPRNVMFITFTDEVGDDQAEMLDKAVDACRRYGIRNYVVGIPAPFGRKSVEVKWIDPDPQFNQDAQWTTLDQGPETLMPERVKIAAPREEHHEESLDSGFGPFSLTRLAVATGGIYFTAHPNRHTGRPVSRFETANLSSYLKYFFDSDVMRKYRPDYVTTAEYQKRLRANRAKRSLVDAARLSWVTPMANPQRRFPRRDEADLARQLSLAQQQAAKLEPKVQSLYNTLHVGRKDRDKLTEPRWQAGFDLAIGQVLALKVRTEGYNIMLAKAKRGMTFQNSKNDTWILRPSRQINAGSVVEKEAQQAEVFLRRVVDEHPGTPWAKVASETLATPLGWEWTETFTNVNPPRVAQPGNNNRPAPPRDDQRNVIPPKPVRNPPKL